MQTNKEAIGAWLGRVYVLDSNDTQAPQYSATVAVWAKDRNHFDIQLEAYMASNHLQLQHVEDVMTALEWLQQNPADQQTIELARRVYENLPVVLSPLKTINTNAVTPQHPDQIAYVNVAALDHIEPLGHIEPFGSTTSSSTGNAKTVPAMLQDALFGQVSPTEADIEKYGSADAVPSLKTYAVLCAATVASLRDMMDESNLQWRCLFKGEKEKELKDAAPHLIELKEGNAFARRLFTYLPDYSDSDYTMHLWHKKPGIYIRSRASFDDLLQHIRKFHRLENEQGKGYFFRFWDPRTVRMIQYQRHDPESPIIRLCDRRFVHTLYAFSNKANLCVQPIAALPKANGTPILRQVDTDVLADISEADFLDKVYATLETDHPDLHAATDIEDIKTLYIQAQKRQYTSSAASWDFIRSVLLLQKLKARQSKGQPTINLKTVEDAVDPNRDYSPTKRAERIWQWTNTHASKGASTP